MADRHPGEQLTYVVGFGLASLAFGFSIGIFGPAMGMSPVAVVLMSALVFGGAAQFGALGVIAAGGGPPAAILVGLLLNSRFLLMGLPVAARSRATVRQRLAMAVVATDAPLLAAVVQPDDARAHRDYWRVGATCFVAWLVGTVIGVTVGADPGVFERFGVDALVPAVFIGLLAPLLGDRAGRTAALVGALIGALAVPVAPPGVPVLAGAVAGTLAATLVVLRRGQCDGVT